MAYRFESCPDYTLIPIRVCQLREIVNVERYEKMTLNNSPQLGGGGDLAFILNIYRQ